MTIMTAITHIQSRRSIGRMPDYESGDWGSNPCVTAKKGFKVSGFKVSELGVVPNRETLKPETLKPQMPR